MHRLRMYACVTIVVCLFSSLPANDVNTGGQLGVVRALSSYTLGKTGLHAGGSFRFATEMDYVRGTNGKGTNILYEKNGVTTVVSRKESPFLFTGDIFCAYGLLDFLDVSLNLPIYYDKAGWKEEDVGGAGDLELGIKMAYPFQKDSTFFAHSYFLKVIFPTGGDRGFFPRHSYHIGLKNTADDAFSTGTVVFNPMIIWTFDFEKLSAQIPLQIHMNAGGVVAQRRSSIISAAMGIVYTPVPVTTFFIEIAGESRVSNYQTGVDLTGINNDPLWVSPGIKFNLPLGFYATCVGDIGISDNNPESYENWRTAGDDPKGSYNYSTKGTPRYGVQFTVGWKGILKEADSDNDGIIDKKDGCPREAEDMDAFSDDDGCPDPDNDNDGFVDSQDRCPDSAGTDQGCPVVDADNDGIENNVDKCPDQAEDKDGFEDSDGCPELDNDNDGVVDGKDNCPNKAEDADGFEDGDGCPDTDNDGDGVSDVEDKCPGVRGLPENNGCPKTKEIQRGKLVLSGVTFQAGKAILTSNSYTILDQVYESLVEWPEVKLEIQGHTDNLGNNTTNLKLSQLRADAVKEYLVRKGISADRLRSVGYGEEFPIADNHTSEGREKNRRVELRRID